MKTYRNGVWFGIGISFIFYIFILDTVLKTLAYFEIISPLKEYTYNDIAREHGGYQVYAKGLSPQMGLKKKQIGPFSAELPLAALYKTELVLEFTPDIIQEICIHKAEYNQFNNIEWGVAIRLKDKDLIKNIASEIVSTGEATFSLFRLGTAGDLLQIGRFSKDEKNNYTTMQIAPNNAEMHIFFPEKDAASIASELILLSPNRKILPCHGQINMELYNRHKNWRPLPANFIEQ